MHRAPAYGTHLPPPPDGSRSRAPDFQGLGFPEDRSGVFGGMSPESQRPMPVAGKERKGLVDDQTAESGADCAFGRRRGRASSKDTPTVGRTALAGRRP